MLIIQPEEITTTIYQSKVKLRPVNETTVKQISNSSNRLHMHTEKAAVLCQRGRMTSCPVLLDESTQPARGSNAHINKQFPFTRRKKNVAIIEESSADLPNNVVNSEKIYLFLIITPNIACRELKPTAD